MLQGQREKYFTCIRVVFPLPAVPMTIHTTGLCPGCPRGAANKRGGVKIEWERSSINLRLALEAGFCSSITKGTTNANKKCEIQEKAQLSTSQPDTNEDTAVQQQMVSTQLTVRTKISCVRNGSAQRRCTALPYTSRWALAWNFFETQKDQRLGERMLRVSRWADFTLDCVIAPYILNFYCFKTVSL